MAWLPATKSGRATSEDAEAEHGLARWITPFSGVPHTWPMNLNETDVYAGWPGGHDAARGRAKTMVFLEPSQGQQNGRDPPLPGENWVYLTQHCHIYPLKWSQFPSNNRWGVLDRTI